LPEIARGILPEIASGILPVKCDCDLDLRGPVPLPFSPRQPARLL